MNYILLIVIIILIVYLLYDDKKEHICVLGIGDCGVKTKSTQETTVNQEILNKTDIKMIKENITKNMMNVMTKKAAVCSARQQAEQSQDVEFGDVGGDFNVNMGDQKQKVKLQLTCIQMNEVKNDLAQTITTDIAERLDTKFDTAAMAKLEADASAKATSGVLPTGKAEADVNVKNNYNLSVKNDISKTMKNVIVNETNKNFNTETLAQSLASTIAKQKQRVGAKKVGGNVNLTMGSQDQDVETFFKAIQEDKTVNKTVDTIANKLNSISSEGVTTKAAAETKTKTSAESEQKGVDTIVDSIFGAYKWIMIAGVIGIVIVLAIFFFTGGQETLQKGIEVTGEVAKQGIETTGDVATEVAPIAAELAPMAVGGPAGGIASALLKGGKFEYSSLVSGFKNINSIMNGGCNMTALMAGFKNINKIM
jgi:hypothetical protein